MDSSKREKELLCNMFPYRVLKIYAVWGEVKVFTLAGHFLLLISSEGSWKA